ncbi:MAG: hypothetical protein LBB76_12615 [Azoarcus sp.]|nr:hypothetical protein [Azoarcus sp.]
MKRAILTIVTTSAFLVCFFVLMLAGVVMTDHGKPQFFYELIIAAAGVVYFGALSVHTWRGTRHVLSEQELAHTIRVFSQSVIGMVIPVAVGSIFLVWLLCIPVY